VAYQGYFGCFFPKCQDIGLVVDVDVGVDVYLWLDENAFIHINMYTSMSVYVYA